MKTTFLLIVLMISIESFAQVAEPQEQKEIEVYGLDQFKKTRNAAVAFELVGASSILGYFIWDGIQKEKIEDYVRNWKPGTYFNAPERASKIPLHFGIGFMTIGVVVHISAISKLAQSRHKG